MTLSVSDLGVFRFFLLFAYDTDFIKNKLGIHKLTCNIGQANRSF